MSTWLITGGLGFIGSNLRDVLLEAGHSVVIFDNEATGHNHIKHDKVTTIIGDITKVEDLKKLPSGIEYVVHLAAAISVAESMKLPEKYELNNIQGSKNVLEWAVSAKVKAVVSASSAAVYGDPESLPLDEDAKKNMISPYATTKYGMEDLHKKYSEESGITMICLRFFNVYGPRQDPKSQYSGVISKFFDMASSNQPLTIFGDGKATRDFVFVKDIASAIILASTKGKGFNYYNVGTESITTITELAQKIIKSAGATSEIKYGPAREGDIVHSRASIAKITKDLGYKPSKTLEQGLAITYQWFLDDKAASK